MDAQPVLHKIAFALFLILGCVSSMHATSEWRSVTATNEMRRMRVYNDTLFAATSGGLVVVPSVNASPEVFTNADGLGTSDLNEVIRDSDGETWVGGNGSLTRFRHTGSEIYPTFNQDGPDRLLCVADDNRWLWIGSEKGLLLFDKDANGGQFLDRYSISFTNPFPAVNSIALVGDTIWLATSAGIARGVTTAPAQLKSPANWIMYDMFSNPELLVASHARVVSFHDDIYVGNARGIYRYTIDTLSDDTSFVRLSLAMDREVFEMTVERDTLFCYSDGNFRSISSAGVFGAPSQAGLLRAPRTGARSGNAAWAGLYDEGYFAELSGAFQPIAVPGLPDNNVSDVVASQSGTLTALFTSMKHVGRQSSDEWITEPLEPVNTYQGTTLASIDSTGSCWLGTFGNGLFRLSADSLENFDEQNSALIGNLEGASYVVIRGLALTHRHLFAACYRAVNGKPIAIANLADISNPSSWTSLGIADGITDHFASALDVYGGTLAYGTEGNGVYLYNYGDDPFDKTDDVVRHFTETDASQLVSNNITTLRFSPTGELWAGTSFGLTRYDDGIERWIDTDLPEAIGPEVLDIDFDMRGTMWVAARGGLARYDPVSGASEGFTTRNSGLISGDIHALTVDRFRGDLYVSTSHGISLLTSAFEEPTTSVSSVLAFPNPFLTSGDGLRFNFAGKGTARIFTAAGESIIDIPVNGVWDGRNASGSPVASGVYLFTITDRQGNIGHGKFLLIRR